MKKIIFAIVLFSVSWAANAVTVTVALIQHNQTSNSGTVSTLITDGSHVSGIAGPTTAVWGWDGTTLTSVGLYSNVSSIGSSRFTSTIISDQVTSLLINTSTSTASATTYSCVEGTFLAAVGASGCGGHNFGANFTNESTTVWGPGLAVSRTLGGDDVATGGAPRSISAYDFGLVSSDGMNVGDMITIGNGISLSSGGSEAMTFMVIPPPPSSVTITIGGANLQECSEANGATVDFTAGIIQPPDDAVASVEWFLDAASIGFGAFLAAHVPLGTHTIEVLVTSVLGQTSTASQPIHIADTTAPSIAASFSDAKGNPITSVGGNGRKRIRVNYDVTDVCDPVPSVSAVSGVDADNGELVTIHAKKGTVTISEAQDLLLHVTATDASGNVAEQAEVLPIKD